MKPNKLSHGRTDRLIGMFHFQQPIATSIIIKDTKTVLRITILNRPWKIEALLLTKRNSQIIQINSLTVFFSEHNRCDTKNPSLNDKIIYRNE